MYRLTDLWYSTWFRTVAGVAVVGVLVYGSIVAFDAFGSAAGDQGSPTTTVTATPETTDPVRVGGSADETLTANGEQCRSAVVAMTQITTETASVDTLNTLPDEAFRFSQNYEIATETCTYREFVRFEQDVLLAWSGGIAIDTAIDDVAAAQDPENDNE